jgi:hypothetical protein
MRSSLRLIAFLSSLALFSQQADIWKNVRTDPADQPKTVTPSPQQLVTIISNSAQ